MKKLNQKGFTHHLVMFVILAVVLGAMGFAGYRVWQNRNIDAQAASWKQVKVLSSTGGGVNGTLEYTQWKTPIAGYYRTCAYGVRSMYPNNTKVSINLNSSKVSRRTHKAMVTICTIGTYYLKGTVLVSWIYSNNGVYYTKAEIQIKGLTHY